MKEEHVVGLILDPKFGQRIVSCSLEFHCWLLETEENLKYKEEVWKRIDPNSDPLETGITLFKTSKNDLEKECLEMTEVILDHHNEHHHYPGINVLKVYGVHLTRRLENNMLKYGFSKFTKFALNDVGFEAKM